MAYVPVPKDLTTVKTKVMFNLTKRQLICFGAGAAVALPLFFLCKKSMDTSVAPRRLRVSLRVLTTSWSWVLHTCKSFLPTTMDQ